MAVCVLGDERDQAGYVVLFNGHVAAKVESLPPEKSTLRFKLKDNEAAVKNVLIQNFWS